MAGMSSGELLERLTRALGPEAASALMKRLPPAGARTVTREDVAERIGELERRIDARFDAVDARFDALLQTLEARIGEAKNEILAATRDELIAAVTRQTRTMIATMAGTVVSLMAFLVAFERVAG